MVLHERNWKPILDEFLQFRRYLRDQFGLKLREEIHASAFLSKPGALERIPKHRRLEILRRVLDWVAGRKDLVVMTVVVDKRQVRGDVFDVAWRRLVATFEASLHTGSLPFPSAPEDRGMLFPDNTNGTQLFPLIQKMRHPDPVFTGSDLPGPGGLVYLIEDPIMRDSAQSYFHQIVDVIAYFARQQYEVNAYLKKKGGKNYYRKLAPVLYKGGNLKDPLGIVYA